MNEALSSVFDMGKYGFYVWGSYAVAAIVLAASVIGPYLRLRSLRHQLREQMKYDMQEEGAREQ